VTDDEETGGVVMSDGLQCMSIRKAVSMLKENGSLREELRTKIMVTALGVGQAFEASIVSYLHYLVNSYGIPFLKGFATSNHKKINSFFFISSLHHLSLSPSLHYVAVICP